MTEAETILQKQNVVGAIKNINTSNIHKPLIRKKIEKPAKRKIVVVSEKADFVGGLEKYVYESASVMQSAGYELHAFFAKQKYRLRMLNKNEYIQPFASVCWGYKAKALEKAMQSGISAAVVHSCSSPSFVKKLNECFKTIFFVHDHRYYCQRGQKYFPIINVNCMLARRKIYCNICARFSRANNTQVNVLPHLQHSAAVVVLSSHMKKNLIINKIPEQKIKVIPPVVARKRINEQTVTPVSSSDETIRLCFVGQLVRGKGVDLLFKTFARLLKNNNKFMLHLVGEGCQHAELIIMAQQLRILQSVVFYGKHQSPQRIVASSDIVIVPSRWQEPFALVGVEAMLQAKPVIAFRRGGMLEWLEDGVTGLFAEPGSARSLQKQILQLANSVDLRKKMGEAAKLAAERKFGKNNFIKNFNALIAEME